MSAVCEIPKSRRLMRMGLAVTVAGLLLTLAFASRCYAGVPWWHVIASATPTNLPPGGEGQITVVATNRGDAEVNGASTPVVIADKLPAGLTATAISGTRGFFGTGEVECVLSSLTCTFAGTTPSYAQLEVSITVTVAPNAPASGENEATVHGGEAEDAAVRQPVQVAAAATPFGVDRYEVAIEDERGAPDIQAGTHPFQLTSLVSLNQTVEPGSLLPKAPALARNLHLKLPPGLIGNATGLPQCTEAEFLASVNFTNRCRLDTALGVASATIIEPVLFGPTPVTVVVPLFNLVPREGEPARFGFVAFKIPVALDTSVRTGSDYGVTVDVNNISQSAVLLASVVTLWGVPGDPAHDQARGWGCVAGGFWGPFISESCTALGRANAPPFLTLPTSCTGPLRTIIEAASWRQPMGFIPPLQYEFPQDIDGHAVGLTGCDRLVFDPTIEVATERQAASVPSGLMLDVHVPHATTLTATDLAESDVRDTTVTLPEGVQINPASAGGLEACSTGEVGFERFDEPTQSELFSPGPTTCPDAAKVGTVEIQTPLLPNPLLGAAYLAAQNANPFGSLLALYIVADDPVSGVRVKLAGKVMPDPATGRLTSTFENTPQLPFEHLKLRLFGGSHAPLSTPPYCGTYTVAASFTPWSGNAPVTPSSSFAVTSGPNGSRCTSPLPFSPALTAGSANIQAAVSTPFSATMSREDGNQNLAGITVHMPPGLLGRLSSVTPCQEPQASEGTCGPESLIGHTVVSVGLGPDPYAISGGKVFITGPYKGAPYGLSLAQPAKAGPFDLGGGPCDCIVVRAKIEVDPHSSALTIVSDPLPTILQGIPLQIKHANVTVDRPGFMFNPTNCNQLAIAATISSEQGATAQASVPFEVANCATLPFKPRFTVLTQAKTSKAKGASLHVKVTSGPRQANIGKVKVDLPKQLPSRLTTLQKACPDATFNANPGVCPSGSLVGTATAVTPILRNPLKGPAYLVSHAARAFPDLVIVLQGEGIVLDLVGNTDIKKGVTISSFNSVPDAPITSFDLVLPQGPHSALAAYGSLCKTALKMPTVLTGQNGAVIRRTTKVAVSGCPKHKHSKKRKRQTPIRDRKHLAILG